MPEYEDVTIGMFARERYSMTARAIDKLREKMTPGNPRLILIDAATPPKYRPDIQAALDRFGNYSVITTGRYEWPIQTTNRLIQACQTEVLALVQNDVLVDEGWLEPILEDLNTDPKLDYVSPQLMEAHQYPIGPDTRIVYHFNPTVSEITDLGEGRMKSTVKRIPGKDAESFDINQPRLIKHLEEHALYGRTASFQAVAPFPDHLNTREQIAMVMQIHLAGQRILFDPRSSVTYIEIPLEPEEIPNYLLRWDPEKGVTSNDYVRTRWNLQDYSDSRGDVLRRYNRAQALQRQQLGKT